MAEARESPAASAPPPTLTPPAAVGAAWVVAFNIWTAPARNAFPYVPRLSTALAVGIWLVCGTLAGAYDLRGTYTMRTALRQVLSTVGLSTVGLFVAFFIDPYRVTRPTVLIFAPASFVASLSARWLFRRVFMTRALAGSMALIMTSEGLERVWPEVRPELGTLYRVAARIDPYQVDSGQKLLNALEPRRIDEVVVGVRGNISREFFRALVTCYERGVRVRSLTDLYEELTGRLLLDQLGEAWLMSIPMRGDTSRLYAAFKRGMDIVAGLIGCVLMLPFVPVLFAANLLTAPGPLFYGQRRVGKHGREFMLWKFRTMRVGGATDWTQKGDPRVTPAGKVLRRLHLDELPQALNILARQMSLIGPRPEQPRYVDELSAQIDFYRTRLTVRPGLTGWAQVNHGYGSGIEGARVKLSYDLYYIKRQSVSLDMAILARTVAEVLSLGGR